MFIIFDSVFTRTVAAADGAVPRGPFLPKLVIRLGQTIQYRGAIKTMWPLKSSALFTLHLSAYTCTNKFIQPATEALFLC